MAGELFPERAPPRGGLLRLRERLDRESAARWPRAAWTLALAPALVAVVLALAWSFGERRAPDAFQPAFIAAARVARGDLLEEPVTPLPGSGGAVQRLPSPPGVLIYRFAAAPAGPPAPRL